MSFGLRIHSSKARNDYAPATVAADIARIIDPSYAHARSGSGASTPNSYQPKAYIDRDGNMHDPDFQMFPTLVPVRGGSRRQSASSDLSSNYRNSSYYSPEPAYSAPSSSSHSNEPINFYHRPSFEESVYFFDDATPTEEPQPVESTSSSRPNRSLRYQLHAIQLDLRLKVVRAKRRWRERRASHMPR
jgi:hypothetical protein